MRDTNPDGKSAASPIPPEPPRRKCLSYVRGVWGEVDDPLGDANGDFHDLMHKAGYCHIHNHGAEDAALWLEVFEFLNGGHFIVSVNTTNSGHDIHVADVPSLFMLLGELLPVIEATARLGVVEEVYEQKMKRLRQQHAGRIGKAVAR
jgi:hypothetical protein